MPRHPAESKPITPNLQVVVAVERALHDRLGDISPDTTLTTTGAVTPTVVSPEETQARRMEWAGQEVRRLEARALLDQYHVGVLMLEMKRELAFGQFAAWLQQWWPLGARTAQYRMEFAELVGNRQSLLSALGEISAKKVRALLELPEEDIRAIEESGTVAGIPFAEIREMPYAQLKARLTKADSAAADAEAQAAEAATKLKDKEEKLARANERIAELTDPHRKKSQSEDEDELLDQLRTARQKHVEATTALNRILDACGTRIAEQTEAEDTGDTREMVSVAFVAEVVGVSEFVVQLADHTRQRFRVMAGQAQCDAAYVEIIRANERLAGADAGIRIPHHQRLVMPEADDAKPAKRGK